MNSKQKITTFLTYDNQAEEAARLYTSIFADGKITSVTPGPKGTVMSVTFQLFGQTFFALNGGPSFTFSQGISLFVSCETQEEIDTYWEKLGEGGKPIQCGWLTDRFGVCWQIIPRTLGEMLSDPDPQKAGRVMQAMMQMQKLDIAALKRAREGGSAAGSQA